MVAVTAKLDMNKPDEQLKARVKGWLYIGEGASIALGAIAWLWFIFFEPLPIDYVIFFALLVPAAFFIYFGVRALRYSADP